MRSPREQVRIHYLVARGAYDPEQHLAEWAEHPGPVTSEDNAARVWRWLGEALLAAGVMLYIWLRNR